MLEETILRLEDEILTSRKHKTQLHAKSADLEKLHSELDEVKEQYKVATEASSLANDTVILLKERIEELSQLLACSELRRKELDTTLDETSRMSEDKVAECLYFQQSIEKMTDELNSKNADITVLESRIQSYAENEYVLNSKVEELQDCKSTQSLLISSLQRDVQDSENVKLASFRGSEIF